ncbi:MAG TPA: phosphotransferase family protein [Mycobacteriales bacterium]|nr:phosphotransferase family protein [Mycobacteriales bacterium]
MAHPADPTAVAAWMRAQGIAVADPLRADLIAGGRSNLTYKLTDGAGATWVLRRPPTGHVLATAHDMGREWRFISAFHPTPVPVPEPVALCEDATVVGAPFYVMGHVEGTVLNDDSAAAGLSEDARRVLSFDLVEVLADLHAVDIDVAGIGTIGPREDYLARQLRRWNKQWEATSEPAGLQALPVAELHAKLTAAAPPQERTAVVHGDYRVGNVITSAAGRVQAVLDWELAALGDPLADVGWMLGGWLEAGEDGGQTISSLSPTHLPGFATRRAVAQRYADLTGTDVGRIDYYIAFAHWRRAAILAGVAARYLAGVMGDDGIDPHEYRDAVEAGLRPTIEDALALLA